jgi:hypothetical protein
LTVAALGGLGVVPVMVPVAPDAIEAAPSPMTTAVAREGRRGRIAHV